MTRPEASVWLEDATARLRPVLLELDDTLTDDRDDEVPDALVEAAPRDAEVDTPNSLARPTVSTTLPSARWRMTRQLSEAGAADAADAADAIAAAAARQVCDRMVMDLLPTDAAGWPGGVASDQLGLRGGLALAAESPNTSAFDPSRVVSP